MIAAAAAWLIGKGVSTKLAKPLVIVGLVVLLIAALGTAKCAYDRSVIKSHTREQEAKQTKRERTADANLERQRDVDDAAAVARQKEINDATRNIPDQGLSARQLARVCIELRRQAPSAHHPACEPAPAR